MPLQTTCIGAYPKPLKGGTDHWRPTAGAEEQARQFTYIEGDEQAVPGTDLDAATRMAVRDQVACGIHIPIDGEQRRENYIHYHCRHLAGIDFQQLTTKLYRNNGAVGDLPTIVGKVTPPWGPFSRP